MALGQLPQLQMIVMADMYRQLVDGVANGQVDSKMAETVLHFLMGLHRQFGTKTIG